LKFDCAIKIHTKIAHPPADGIQLKFAGFLSGKRNPRPLRLSFFNHYWMISRNDNPRPGRASPGPAVRRIDRGGSHHGPLAQVFA
jgi:hypothetical protein